MQISSAVNDLPVVLWCTLGWIPLPGGVTGVLLGWAACVRRTGRRREWRWLALPLVLAAVTLHRPWDLPLLFQEDPLDSGAVGTALFRWRPGMPCRDVAGCGSLVCGALALTVIPLWEIPVSGVSGPARP